MTRREFAALPSSFALAQNASRRPNVVFLLTDDQGYGDLSIHGNPHIQTPAIDSLARDGAQFTQFHSSPVCSPTRSSLMTGRYNYRTGVVDTYIGRSIMRPDEVTLPQLMKTAGYRTGIFGKWHLGDHYPTRAMDRGFDESVVHYGGGIGQPADPPGGESYFHPILQHNGVAKRYEGYCTDVFFDEAMRFIETNRSRPFFTYVPANAPHTPLEVAEQWAEPFRKRGLADREARIYGMCANLDHNVGRLLTHLKRLHLERDTMVFFTTDNGPQTPRFNGGMRGLKGTVYEGGIRVPFFVRWPGRVKAGTVSDRLAAHIDVMPTLAEVCGFAPPKDRPIDGRSLAPLLDGKADGWRDRTMFFQWHRGDVPQSWRNACARTQRWKLVEGKELYDLAADPAESKDVAVANPEVVAKLRSDYDGWFRDVCSKGFDPIRIRIGTPQENPVTLSQQDWRSANGTWGPDGLGHWEIDVTAAGRYEVGFLLYPRAEQRELKIGVGTHSQTIPVAPGLVSIVLAPLDLPKGPAKLTAVLSAGGKESGVRFATLRRL